MSKWVVRRLDDLVSDGSITLGRGDVISKEHIDAIPGPYPIYSSSAHNNGKFGEYGRYMFDEELITWSVDGGGALFYRPKHRYSVTNVCGYMRVKSGDLSPRFLHYVLSLQHEHLTFDYTTKAHPSVIKKLYYVPTISPGTQKKLAAILETVDEAIERTQALIGKYEQVKAGMMQDLFTRGLTPDGKLRPPRHDAPDLYQETSIGWIPKDWEPVKLRQILVRIDSGWSPDCIERSPAEGEWGVLKVSSVTRGAFDPAESKTLPKSLAPRPSLEVHNGQVVMTRANGVASLVGKCVQVTRTPSQLMLSDKLLRLVPDHQSLTEDFLTLLMGSFIVTAQIDKVLSGSSGQKNISQKQIFEFDGVKPNRTEQSLIATKIRSVDTWLYNVNLELHKLRQMKAGLMQDLLTGKVPVEG